MSSSEIENLCCTTAEEEIIASSVKYEKHKIVCPPKMT